MPSGSLTSWAIGRSDRVSLGQLVFFIYRVSVPRRRDANEGQSGGVMPRDWQLGREGAHGVSPLGDAVCPFAAHFFSALEKGPVWLSRPHAPGVASRLTQTWS